MGSWARDGSILGFDDASCRNDFSIEEIVTDSLSGTASIDEVIVVSTSIGDSGRSSTLLQIESVADGLKTHSVLVGAQLESFSLFNQVCIRLPG